MKRYIFLIVLIISACKTSVDYKFEKENEQIKSEFKIQSDKFVKANFSKLTEQQMLNGMDSIVVEYTINRNKKLAVKYVDSKKGLKRLNFLKDKFSKTELINLLNQVSEDLKTDSNYLDIQSYLK